MKASRVDFIVICLIFLTTCSTYYLHWRVSYDWTERDKFRFRHSQSPKTLPETLPETLPKIAVAIPTHNRIGYVQLTSKALHGTYTPKDIWVFDDMSTEYGYKELLNWYATNNVFVTKKHLKADAMARHILEWFVNTEYDILVLLDSDMVVAPNWWKSLNRGLQESKGILSLYNSAAPKHKSVHCGNVLCQQSSMGNAGTVWRRDLAKRMLSEMSARDGGFDWGWPEWCSNNNIPMEALKESAVLHIGVHGSWSHESTAEKSVGFPMKELSVDVRKQAEIFLKGEKPKRIIEKEKSKRQAIHINEGTDRIKCDVPCFWPTGGGPVVRTIHIDELKTTMTMSMEGEKIYPSLKLSNRKKNHAIASTRFDSDIPMPYFNWPWTLYMDETPKGEDKWSKNYIQTPHVPLVSVKKAAVFIARNCGSKSNREDLVKSLMKLMPIDSVSSCLHNFDPPQTTDKYKMMQKYALYFAFENQRVDDYITEKLWRTFRAGVLPVYFGAPNIKEHVPEHSIVNVDDFASHEELAQHLKDIMSNKELYNSYHAWRYKPLPIHFVQKYNFTHVHSACRVCRWASAKLRGLPWDAINQQILPTPVVIAPTVTALDAINQQILPTPVVIAPTVTALVGIKYNGLTLYRLGSHNIKTLHLSGPGSVNILTKQHYGLFQYQNEGETSFHFENNDSPLWMTVNGNTKVMENVKSVDSVSIAGPKRSLRYLSRSSQSGQITLCTQLTIDRFERLVHFSKTWLGPISATIYIGHRTRADDDILKIQNAWDSEIEMRTWVDIHLVYDQGNPWFSFPDMENTYPVNLLRQISVENAQTDLVLYVEADIQVQYNAHALIMSVNRDGYSSKSVFVLPLFSSTTVPDKVVSWKEFTPIAYASHQGLAFSKWKQSSTIMTYRGEIAAPGKSSKISGQEPYFVVRKSTMPAYDVLYWGMIGDKVQHINDMSEFDFYVLPGCFLVDTPSDGLGEAWLTTHSTYSNYVSSMHSVTISERSAWTKESLQNSSQLVFQHLQNLTNPPTEHWQSYITSTINSVTPLTTKSPAYDSRNIWASQDTCSHSSTVPARPTALFQKWSRKICFEFPKACQLFKKTLVDTWDHGITWLKDGTVFLVTGDIPLMWLRDSSAQVTHYLALSEHSSIQRLIEGVLRRQMKWIELDVYGSAFRMFLDFDHVGKTRLTDWDFKCGRTVHVAQHDYEMDSLAYVVKLAYQYWKKTGRTCWMTEVQKTWHRIVDLWILEQDHSKSKYTYPTLENNGKGTPVCKTGMSWAGMRPSDDKMKYHYNIPGQLFAAKALEYIEEMSSLWSDDTLKQKALKLRLEIIKGVEKYGVVDGVLAYETDGCGHHLMVDDANIPSLLSLPYLGIERHEYEKTRQFILSNKNPWWSKGGIGSPHTNGRGHPWHLSMIMEGWKDHSTLDRVLKTAYGGSLHESVTMSGGSTRKWFGWANALFSEWLMLVDEPHNVFEKRLELFLPKQPYLFPSDVLPVEKKIVTFDIPTRVSIRFETEYVPIYAKNWMRDNPQLCPNCEIVNDKKATVKWILGCPRNPKRDFGSQILVCHCGESAVGTGKHYFNEGIHKCDIDASYLNNDIHETYSHLHLTPPQHKHVKSVSEEMERYLEMPPQQQNGAVFIHSDCGHKRGTFVSKMIELGIIEIDRYGKCWNNKNIKNKEPSPANWYWGDSEGNRDTTKTDILTDYKFSFALENTESKDYFTEKRYQAFLGLSIPIVWKNNNSDKYTPGENSVIYPEDYDNDPKKLSEYLLKLSRDAQAYKKHLSWKKKGIRRDFVKLLFKKHDFVACRICERVSKNMPTTSKISTSLKIVTITSPRPSHPDITILNQTLHAMYYHYPLWSKFNHYLLFDGCPLNKKYWEHKWCSQYKQFFKRMKNELKLYEYFKNIHIIEPESWSERMGLTGTIKHGFETAKILKDDIVYIQQDDTRLINNKMDTDNILSRVNKLNPPYLRLLMNNEENGRGAQGYRPEECTFSDHPHFVRADMYYNDIFPKLAEQPGAAPEDLTGRGRLTPTGCPHLCCNIPMVEHIDGMEQYKGTWAARPKKWIHDYPLQIYKDHKYVVIIPSVKRNDDKYLQKTLSSLNIAKPLDVPVILINGNQPPEKHTYLIEWCQTHKDYEYRIPPIVSEELIQTVIRQDKRGDTKHFLRWRTTETEHALFGFKQALKTNAEYIIWLQDDVIIKENLFKQLVPDDIICLQDGKNYCGAVAYMFSKKFVEKLILKIEKNKISMPIDWIIFDLRPVLTLEKQGKPIPKDMPNRPRRIPLVTHIGKKSTKNKNVYKIKELSSNIKTSDLFAAIDYNAPENKGPWKQGWDYDGRFKNERPFVHQDGHVFPKFSSLQRPSITPMKVVSGSIKKCQEAWPTFITKKIKNADIEISVKCSEDVFIDFVDDAEFPKDHMDDWRDISIEERRNAKVLKVPNNRQQIKGNTFLLGNHPYVDIQCGKNHNYIARFVPNEKIRKKKLTEIVMPNARSIISIKLDSLSNAHAHRTLKKTLTLLKNMPGHIEFPFYNSISGGTAANMLPIFSGQPFTHREARHSVHWLIQKLEQTIWDVANKMGYITSVGGSNGNGIGGSRTLCTRCDHRPPVLPFWTHNWVKNEFFSKNNEKIHRCAGNLDIFEFGLQYISDLFDYASGHPVFAHMSFQDLHTPNPEWALVPSDEILANFISKITNKYTDTSIFIYGDHGRPMTFLTGDEIHFEERNGYLAIIDTVNTHKLLENQQKPIVPWDIHATMLGIITQKGEHKYGIDLRHNSVSKKRTCLEAGLDDSECLFGQYKNKLEIPPVNELTEKIQKIFQNINEENENFEICKSLTPAIILRPTIVYGQIHVNVITHQGPTLWDITGKSVNDLHATQISQWDIFEDCVPHNAKHNACVCKNLESFPVKIGYETNSLPIAFVVMENDYFPSILKYDIDDKQIFTLGNSDTNIIVPETPFENGLNKFIQTMSILLKSISSYCIGFVRGPLQYTKEDFLSYSKCAENILISDSSNIIIFKRDELKFFLYWLENNEDESNIITAIHNYKTKKIIKMSKKSILWTYLLLLTTTRPKTGVRGNKAGITTTTIVSKMASRCTSSPTHTTTLVGLKRTTPTIRLKQDTFSILWSLH